MKAKLVTYRTENLSNSERSKLSKKLYGYTDKSHYGEYAYKRKGLLDDTTYIKVYNNTFIISVEDWPTIKKELEEREANMKVWDIILLDDI